jgi:hypothetical protein
VGRYVNPGNEGFARIVGSEYVDKTGLVSLFDSTLNTTRGLVMVSRPRRFGKSYAAQAVAAFYSRGCDSRELFEGLEVSRRDGWDEHLNAYNVVKLDMTGVIEAAGPAGVVPELRRLLLGELRESGLIAESELGEGRVLVLTPDGREALSLFPESIRPSVRERIRESAARFRPRPGPLCPPVLPWQRPGWSWEYPGPPRPSPLQRSAAWYRRYPGPWRSLRPRRRE